MKSDEDKTVPDNQETEKNEQRNTDQVLDELEKQRFGQLGDQGVKTCIWGKYR